LVGSNHAISRRQNNLQFILQPTAFVQKQVAEYFASETTDTPARPLLGIVIGLIMARRAPEGLGEFASDLYIQAQEELTNEEAFPSPMSGDFTTLEQIYAEKIAAILPAFEAAWREKNYHLGDADLAFINLTKRQPLDSSSVVHLVKSAANSPSPADSAEAPFNSVERLAQLKLNVRVRGGVIQHPTFISRDASFNGTALQVRRTGVRKGSGENQRQYLGSYRDCTGQWRSVPSLHPETILGIARSLCQGPDSDPDLFTPAASSVLDPNLDPSRIDYKFVAQQGSDRRRKDARVGGPNIGPRSAEFHVRLFRDIGLTASDAERLSGSDLKQLVLLAINLHAVADEKDVAAA
jgi:hypothetical protein